MPVAEIGSSSIENSGDEEYYYSVRSCCGANAESASKSSEKVIDYGHDVSFLSRGTAKTHVVNS